MKKGRPGIMLSVMSSKTTLDELCSVIYSQTSTLGLRIQSIGRRKLPRREMEVTTSFGNLRAKAVLRNGREVIAPEFDECKRISDERRLPILDVIRTIDRELSNRG
jgi:uncharacterized protein (DUF111 family)